MNEPTDENNIILKGGSGDGQYCKAESGVLSLVDKIDGC